MYESDHADAHDSVAAAGFALSFVSRLPGTLDEATNRFSGASTSTVTAVGLRKRGNPVVYEALGLIETAAVTLFVVSDTYGQLPALGASVVVGGLTYTVRSVEPLDPDARGAITATVIVAR